MRGKVEARVVSDGGRKAVCLQNGAVRAVIDAQGGMMPEFGLLRGAGLVNAHWIPAFRANGGAPWSGSDHAAFWKAKILYHIAGDFPCAPNFGPGCLVDGVELPPHGWTADGEWRLEGFGVADDVADGVAEAARDGPAWARFSMESPEASLPLSFRKADLVFGGQDAYFSVMTVRNNGPKPVSVNVGRHNTLGAPFLQAGCRISLAADRFLAAPSGTEFDATGRLARGAEFRDLSRVPLRAGGTADISRVPGMIGHTDFVTGAIPAGLSLAWSCVVNPELRLAYVCFFPGAAGLPEGEIALSFNDLWMQYGGRNFTPWAMGEGESDGTFCLGTENVTGAFANGLASARRNPEILGKPTLVDIPAFGERRLCYGTALLELGEDLVREGVTRAEAVEGGLVLVGTRHSLSFPIGADFEAARGFAGKG